MARQNFMGVQGGYGFGQGFSTVGLPGTPYMTPRPSMGPGGSQQPMAGAQQGQGWAGGDPLSGIFGNLPRDRQLGREGTATITNEELLGLVRGDAQKQQELLDFNYEQNKGFQDQFRSFLEGLPSSTRDQELALQDTADAEAAKIAAKGDMGLGSARRMMREILGDVRSMNEAAAARAEEALANFKDMTAEQISAASLGGQRQFEQERMQVMSNPNMTDAQKRDVIDRRNQSRRQELQAQATAIWSNHNDRALAGGMEVANILQQGAKLYSDAAAQQHQIVDNARARQVAAYEAAGNMRTGARMQVLASQQQARQLQLSGYGALGQFVASNPRQGVQMQSIGYLANYLQQVQPQYSQQAGYGRRGQMASGGMNLPFGQWVPGGDVQRLMGMQSNNKFMNMQQLSHLIHPSRPGPSGMINPYTHELTSGQQRFNNSLDQLLRYQGQA